MNDKDPYIGETFQDRDSRSSYRRVRIIGFVATRGKYHGIQVDEYGKDLLLPNRFYKASTLDTKYRKVSH